MSDTIPGPQGWPFIGNLLDLRNGEYPLAALKTLADRYGPIYQLTIGGNKKLFVSSYKLLNELCDEKKFSKFAGEALQPDGDRPAGLLQAKTDDPNWGIAHRVLMPAFGPLAIEDMFDGKK
jgi:cytochrome P450 / NADPH-cytochrome P450 reductase